MNLSDHKIFPLVSSCARIVAAFWLLGWFIKFAFFKEYLFETIVARPFLLESFPPFLRSAATAQLAYLLPVIIFLVFWRPCRIYFIVSAVIMMSSSGILLLHQDTHNDATFVTSFWTGFWFLWFAGQMHRQDEDFFIHARALAMSVVGLCFLGGFVGKLTPEYWNGQVLTGIFLGRSGEWIKSYMADASVREMFAWISRCVIVGEGFLALAPFWPVRWMFWIGIPFMIGISFFNTWRIFSVLMCLIGLILAAHRLKK